MKIKKKRESISFDSELTPPADKSISHRGIFFSALSNNRVKIRNFLFSQDSLSTIDAFRSLGLDISVKKDEVSISGVGLKGLKNPDKDLYLGNSGTTARLILGLLSAQDFNATIRGDESLSLRPMRRVTEPLSMMGANFKGDDGANFLPIEVIGSKLNGIEYVMPISSAQVKSAILIAGLYAESPTIIHQEYKSRDHTEKMLFSFGANISSNDLEVKIERTDRLNVPNFSVPADISSAAFFITLTLLSPDSKLLLKNVGVNPTRCGFVDVLKRMGANIDIDLTLSERDSVISEPSADIVVSTSRLKGVNVSKEEIPSLIDELPLLFLAAALAEGDSYIEGVSELRVKETDRINSIVTNLTNMGARIEVLGEDVLIKGVEALSYSDLLSFSDHRTAMVNIVAAVLAKGESTIDCLDPIAVSYPGFVEDLNSILDNCIEIV
ncbi:MAG: 3-phosphoshikimate 1-carboxyvinyltransferase [Candidatus Kaelpia aquatica]|nr:3-phosphoshikimate 1-carboxyvinyltransferase [Candidatus Kaelpia aquatica]